MLCRASATCRNRLVRQGKFSCRCVCQMAEEWMIRPPAGWWPVSSGDFRSDGVFYYACSTMIPGAGTHQLLHMQRCLDDHAGAAAPRPETHGRGRMRIMRSRRRMSASFDQGCLWHVVTVSSRKDRRRLRHVILVITANTTEISPREWNLLCRFPRMLCAVPRVLA